MQKHTYLLLGSVVALLIFVFSISLALAAPLMYTSATSLYLTTPAVTFVVATSSLADSVVVNTGNVVVTISNTTGSTLTLTSTSTDFSISASQLGAAAQTCSAGLASVVLSYAPTNGTPGSATFTVTPTASQCTAPAAGLSSGQGPSVSSGGGGGGGGYTPIPTTTSTTTVTGSSATSTDQNQLLKDQIAHLQALLNSLLVQTGGGSHITFTRDLFLGSKGDDVHNLQLLLIAQNKGSAAKALSSHGTTTFFGVLTQKALIEFQKAVHITPASGYFGVKTRGVMNSL